MITALLNKYVLAAIALALTLTAVFGWGYTKGSHSKELELLEKHNKALAEQGAQHARAIQAKARGEREAEKIRTTARPAGPDCDAGEWMHTIQSSVRGANRASSASASAD
ncbi:MAG: hypothetical protein Hals2KO_21450 [Halioglobus sp.]